jgi:hypothetical protein
MPYHSIGHTEGVVRRTGLLLRTMRDADPAYVTERDIELGALAAWFHDTVQASDQAQQDFGLPDGRKVRCLKRIRRSGNRPRQNEYESAEWAALLMGDTYTPHDRVIVAEAILATCPGWDPANRTVLQPYLKTNSPPVARALALADLGAAGMDGVGYLTDAPTLFRVENLDVLAELKRPTGGGFGKVELPAWRGDAQDGTVPLTFAWRQRLMAWYGVQLPFVQGRLARLEKELEGLPSPVRGAVRGLFCKFQEAIEVTQQKQREWEKMDVWGLLKYSGYDVPK